jgi:hypothetical protein
LDFKLHIMDEPRKTLPIIGVLSFLILIALIHITGAVVDYTIWEMDRNAPTINTLTPHIPQPWAHSPEVRETPQRNEGDSGYCDTSCQQRSLVVI